MECHGTPKRKYFCKQACRVLKKTRAKLQRTEAKWVLRSGTPSSHDPAVNSHVRPWGRGWGAGLARLAGYRTLSTLLGCVRLASDAFVRRAKPNKTGGKSINTELRITTPTWKCLSPCLPSAGLEWAHSLLHWLTE